MTVDTLIVNGTLVLPGQTEQTALAILDDTIHAVGDRDNIGPARRVIDADGKYVLPGIVDPHVHVGRDEFGDGDWGSESKAAAVGGVTTMIGFAFQHYADHSLAEEIRMHAADAWDSRVDYSFHAAVTREVSDYPSLLADIAAEGVTSLKVFMSTYPFGVPIGQMDSLFRHAANHNFVVTVHTEEPTICDVRAEELMRDGKGEPQYYPESRPAYAEGVGADIALRLAEQHGIQYYGMHTTCEDSAEVIDSYREYSGERVRTEARIADLVHDESLYEEMGNLAIAAPPLRTGRDVAILFDYIQKGTIDHICTDHCAYCVKDKQIGENWWDAEYGLNGLQFSLPVMYEELCIHRDYSIEKLVQFMSQHPAETFGLPQKGTLEPGTDADITILDPNSPRELQSSELVGHSDYSIYDGKHVTSSVTRTLLRGREIARDGELMDEPGTGRFVAREMPDWESR